MFAAVAGVILTAAGVVLVWRTLVATRAAAGHARRAAKAAEDIVVVTDSTARRQLRAYVHASCQVAIQRDGPATITVTFRNHGQTPAYHFRVRSWASVLEPGSDLKVGKGRVPTSREDIGPDSTVSTQFQYPTLGPEKAEQVRTGKLALYVFGIACYRDAFDVVRTTRFARLYTKGPWVGKHGLISWTSGNKAT
ncbi:MAG: hypothetical protein RIM84_08065 [Alphaproteobacteria bacterium]